VAKYDKLIIVSLILFIASVSSNNDVRS